MKALRHNRWPVPREELNAAADAVAIATAGNPDGSLRVKWKRLDEDERRELVGLVKQGSTGGALAFGSLDKRAARKLEELIEKSAGLDRGELRKRRDEAETLAGIAQLAKRAMRRPVTRDAEGRFFQEVAKQVAGHCLQIDTLGTLLWLVSSMAAGSTADTPHARVEAQGDDVVVIVDRNFGLGFAQGEHGGNLVATLRQLRANSWIEVDGAGRELAVRLGVRGRRALGVRS